MRCCVRSIRCRRFVKCLSDCSLVAAPGAGREHRRTAGRARADRSRDQRRSAGQSSATATRFAKAIPPNSTSCVPSAATPNRSSPRSKPPNARAAESTICAFVSTASSATSSKCRKQTPRACRLNTNAGRHSRTPNASRRRSCATGKRKFSAPKNASFNWRRSSSQTSAGRSQPKQNAFR